MEKSRAPSSAKATVHAIGLKRRPSTACKREDRQIGRDDDEDGVEDRPLHLMGRLLDFFVHRLRAVPRPVEMANDVLHHNHRAIHDHAEVQRAKREQVGGNTFEVETNGGKQQREWNGKGNDKGAADVAEKKKEDDDD